MLPELERLAGNLTRRRAVLETIADAEEPFSFVNLCEMVKRRDSRVSRTTVYRTLRLLLERQLIHSTALRGCDRIFHPHQHAILYVCDDCSRVRAFSSDKVIEELRLIAEKNGFHSIKTTVEVHSTCEELRRTGFCGQDSRRKKRRNHRRAKQLRL